MKKFFIAISVLIVVTLAIVPWLGGKVAESIIRDQVAKTNQRYEDLGQGFKIELIEYDRDFVSSKIITKVTSLFHTKEILITTKARHGLTGIEGTSSLEENEWYRSFVNKNLNGKDPLHITTTHSYLGSMTTDIVLDQFTFTEEKETISVKPAKFSSKTDKDFKFLTINGEWQGVEINSQGIKTTLGSSTVKGDIELISSYVWIGHMEGKSQELQITDNIDTINIVAPHFSVQVDTDKDRKNISVYEKANIDQLQFNDEKVEKVSGGITINNLNREAYETFMQAYASAMRPILENMAEHLEDKTQQEEILEQQISSAMIELIPKTEKLLTKDLQLKLSDIHFTSDEGEIKADIQIQLRKDMTFAEFMPVISQPKLLIDIFSLQSEIILPEAFIAEDEAFLLAPLLPEMQTGIFIKNNGLITHKAETRDGQLYLNEKVVRLQ